MKAAALRASLPERLGERLRPVAEENGISGEHVVYWMHHAVRGHENPALDVAITAALELDVPLVVYQGLGGAHRFNNDRQHTFILEGAREAAAELEGRGLAYAFWLGEQPDAPSPLRELAARAALVVTEDFPAPPFPRWTRRLVASISTPVWAVDTACVVPMRLVGRSYERAYAFRSAIREPLEARLHRPWQELSERPRCFNLSHLAFSPADLFSSDLAELVARCPIDHTVGPVPRTRGGSDAGYERWRVFRENQLRGYASRRNDAAGEGVSGLSPYLHHGQISPLRIAREAAAAGGKGAEKFLDELVVWRELAHNLCFHRHREVESLCVLPGWAQETLAKHSADPREPLTWETLARARTGDRLWNLCQTSLVRHGWLHNNVRMTWGKALPAWTKTPEEALEMLIDLNHRFALDGSDPNSYGGLLWCLGLFDRPFDPERPVLGAVRSRPTEAHAKRLDLDRYARRVERPPTECPLEIAVVGAGLSGLACARTLIDHGHRVQVFEKARGPGGRTATRRAGELRFDHGAQYFTTRDPRFGLRVRSWERAGLVAKWQGRIVVLDDGETRPTQGRTERWVGVPGMNAICGHLTRDIDVRFGVRVEPLERGSGRWRLASTEGEELGSYDVVVVSAPAPQTAELLSAAAPDLSRVAAAVEMTPSWAAMIAAEGLRDLPFDGAFVNGSDLAWLARDASKPGRPERETWIAHATPEWSQANLELDAADAAERLLESFAAATGLESLEPDHLVAHRWRFAQPTEPHPEACLFDAELGIVACGDWAGGPRVEGAFLSGCAAAGRVLSLRPQAGQGELFERADR